MSRQLPPLDLHAHVDVGIAARDLEALGAVVFVATRSLADASLAVERSDAVSIWGVGCHPGVAEAQNNFDVDDLRDLVVRSPFIGEVGLDGGSKVPMDRQLAVFGSILDVAAESPRIVSVHSTRATGRVLEAIADSRASHVVLHWWLGSAAETQRALDLGCYFSVNASMDVRALRQAGVPLDRLLPETDHPSGNRRAAVRQPGWVAEAESAIAEAYAVTTAAVRERSWMALADLVDATNVDSLFSGPVRSMLAAARSLRR